MGQLDGTVAIVTGASSGIGAATARQFAAAGADVALAARSEDRLAAIAEEINAEHPGTPHVVSADVSSSAECEAVVARTVEEFGALDVLVNNAGVGLGDDVATMTDEDFETMMAVNVGGSFYTTRAALDRMDTDGHVIFVGSFAGKYPRPYNPVYAATKWWVRGFAQSLAAQRGDEGLAVSIINPAEVRTEFGSQEGRPFRERFEPGAASEPEEIAEAITYAAAAGQTAPLEIDLYRRDKLADTF